jgi:hypothetical protein
MITRLNIEKIWKEYEELYNLYVEQLKKSKHHYNYDSCPLCKMEREETGLDPAIRNAFGRYCPLCKSESYWAF